MISLTISVTSLVISCIAYTKVKNHYHLQELYLARLKKKQLELINLQNYVTAKRNNVNKEITRLSRSNGRNPNYLINSLTIVDENLKDIENYIKSLGV